MPKAANLNRDQMFNNSQSDPSENGSRVKNRKRLELFLILVAILGCVVVVILYGNVIESVKNTLSHKKEVYGVWVEQDVAYYSARILDIGPDGIAMEGRVYTTRYDFDGHYLTFKVAGQDYKFQMTNSENKEMKQVTNDHYKPIFRMSEKN
ncbi:DUF2850 domain-containing protein [Vibrio ziniensis]|uniref:DUF2850 domain-containing protein n=1 Tax=Vibrio ziniensis TaxID=2711221 RepID=A0A6G7CKF2_9VIBR|nr:DUF2850 domain-containing protein [Vibrio ziniensis]QIH42579.1 DUF2850 domain-containing protein [Vibrio ziniensis]